MKIYCVTHTRENIHTHTHTHALCVRAAQASESRRASWHRRVVRNAMRKEAAAEGPTRARARRCLTRRCQFDEALESLSALIVYREVVIISYRG